MKSFKDLLLEGVAKNQDFNYRLDIAHKISDWLSPESMPLLIPDININWKLNMKPYYYSDKDFSKVEVFDISDVIK